MEENETLKVALQKEQQEAASLKVRLSNSSLIMNTSAVCAMEKIVKHQSSTPI